MLCRKLPRLAFAILLLALSVGGANVSAQTAAFTYQGRLSDGANASPTATYDIKFDLYDMDVDGALIGSVTQSAVFVNNGVFTTSLNFGSAAFDGAARFLEISIRPAGSSQPRTVLQPRQRVTSTPYATQSSKATTAKDFTNPLVGDVTGTQTATVVSTVGGQTAANVAAGATIANAATSANTADAVVRRDANGNFAASTVAAGNLALASGGKITFADGTQQATSVDPSLFVVRNQQSGSVLVADTRLTVAAPPQDTEAFRINSPETNSSVRGGIIARFRSGSPLTDRFRFDQAGGFVALGALGSGVIPASGESVRMMWYPYKGAFRAGNITASGTQWDDANIGFYSWAGGVNTTASGYGTFAFGDNVSVAGQSATAFGVNNTIGNQANFSFSAGIGNETLATSGATVGNDNRSNGDAAMVFGFKSIAQGNYSIALGAYASTCGAVSGTAGSGAICDVGRSGSFSFGDNSTTAYVTASANNQFNARAAGGYRLYSNAAMTTGVSLSAGGGAWTTISDRNAKENFGAVNSRDVLKKVLNLPISTWSYKGQTFRHIGAMAQDFYQAFGVGESDKTITTVDPDGVAFAAIQGLNHEMNERTTKLEAENRALTEQMKTQQTQIERQQTAIDALTKLVCASNARADVCKQQ